MAARCLFCHRFSIFYYLQKKTSLFLKERVQVFEWEIKHGIKSQVKLEKDDLHLKDLNGSPLFYRAKLY